jgi:hypothetical protein
MTDPITGIDYLTGEDGIPISDLRFVTEAADSDAAIFPDATAEFARFAASFVQKYGFGDTTAEAPVVLSPESLAVVRSYYEKTGGEIHNVNDPKAQKSW